MKTYLARFSILEGEHEYRSAFLLSAESTEQAFDIARSQEHEPIILDDTQEPTCWDYGDGTTASRLAGVVEIGREEAATLERLGIAFYFHWENEERYKRQVQCSDNSTFEDCLTVGKSYEVEKVNTGEPFPHTNTKIERMREDVQRNSFRSYAAYPDARAGQARPHRVGSGT